MKAKSRTEDQLLPYETIEAATNGDITAINSVLANFEVYIATLATRSATSTAVRASASTRN